MKRKGKHPEKALSAIKVRNLTAPGRYADGNGLYLVVEPSGAKRWVLRTMVSGRRRDIGLGGLSIVSLADAREQAAQYRALARSGKDPIAIRRQQKSVVPTFEEAARQAHSERKSGWKNEKHAAQWIATLEAYVFPALGNQRVNRIETPEIRHILSAIWLEKPETARRVRQRIGVVLDWATAAGHRQGENPVHGVSRGLPKQPDSKRHFAALSYAEIPRFVKMLRESPTGERTQLALELLILTATRTSELLGAQWSEIDFKEAVWTIPGDRMKAGKEHRVPLSQRAMAILRRAEEISIGSPFVFPGNRPKNPMSNMVFLMVLRRMKVPVTAHGFRSSFRDWAAECTNYPREICEMALAHTIKNKAEAAYRRGDLLEKRRALMADWAEYVGKATNRRQ